MSVSFIGGGDSSTTLKSFYRMVTLRKHSSAKLAQILLVDVREKHSHSQALLFFSSF